MEQAVGVVDLTRGIYCPRLRTGLTVLAVRGPEMGAWVEVPLVVEGDRLVAEQVPPGVERDHPVGAGDHPAGVEAAAAVLLKAAVLRSADGSARSPVPGSVAAQVLESPPWELA